MPQHMLAPIITELLGLVEGLHTSQSQNGINHSTHEHHKLQNQANKQDK